MWSIIAAILSTLIGFGSGATPSQTPTGSTLSMGIKACYNPQPEIKLTLKWPDDFTSVSDFRSNLNPTIFPNLPPYFNSTRDLDGDKIPECKVMILNSKTTDLQKPAVERTFIRVREGVRIASCKTDELAGPYGVGYCPDYQGLAAQAARHRGICAVTGYTDLRKIAEIDQGGRLLEIFWNPFSYNVGCNFHQDENCGPGDRRNINLKDFIYVLKGRDAFDPDTKPLCPVLWDAGSTNLDACSHYFDVYMAEDLYQALQSAPVVSDPHHPYYFLKQVIENCQESSLFLPAAGLIDTMPPGFIPRPFIKQSEAGVGLPDKINPATQTENINYLGYVWRKPNIIKSSLTNLLKTGELAGPPNECAPYVPLPTTPHLTIPPTIPPPPDCFDPLGTIDFKDETGTSVTYIAYSQPAAQQTFSLVNKSDTSAIYTYMITDKDYPTNTRRDPAIQFRKMELVTQNEWTWATPWCKPAIYMYPRSPIDIQVKLELDGQLTDSIPIYDPANGWNVTAYPDGNLVTKPFTGAALANQRYPYLYYEADIKNIEIPKEGWVWKKEELYIRLSQLLQKLGYNDKEITDFLAYWLSRLNDKPYYFVTLLPENIISEKEKLSFSVNPDTVIRARFVFEGLNVPTFVAPLQNLPHKERSGFTVTDWGGTLIGKTCSNISVQ